jgi:hypothetical protein
MSNQLARKIRSEKQLQKYIDKKRIESFPELTDIAFDKMREKLEKGDGIMLERFLKSIMVIRDQPQVAVQVNNNIGGGSSVKVRGSDNWIRLLQERDDTARSGVYDAQAEVIE